MIRLPTRSTRTVTLFPYPTFFRSVYRRTLEVGGDPALADALGDRAALGLQLAMRIVMVEGGAHRVGEADPDLRVAALEVHADARQRAAGADRADEARSEEHTSELQSLMRISYAVFCLKKKKNAKPKFTNSQQQSRSRNDKHKH